MLTKASSSWLPCNSRAQGGSGLRVPVLVWTEDARGGLMRIGTIRCRDGLKSQTKSSEFPRR